MKKETFCIMIMCLLIVILIGCGRKTPTDSDNVSYWQKVESPTTNNLYSVYFVDKDNGWVVGDSGTILHWDGTSWQIIDSPTEESLMGVHFISSNDGWAVGEADHGASPILHYDGVKWEIDTLLGYLSRPTDIFFSSSTNGWITNAPLGKASSSCKLSFALLHYDGTTWEYVNTPYDFSNAFSVYFVSENDGWVAGTIGHPDSILPYFFLAHYDGTYWKIFKNPVEGMYHSSLFFISSTDGWLVGRGAVVHYNGSQWTCVGYPADGSWLESVHFPSANKGWAVGYSASGQPIGVIVHYEEGEWKEENITEVKPLNSVFFVSENEGWAVGSEGVILHYLKD
ncbi:hypothetical protein KAX35_08240 [candidate division WOR-3 bacterium]|nr:hypothetical protein [candidate division WOR-3 bacterium]